MPFSGVGRWKKKLQKCLQSVKKTGKDLCSQGSKYFKKNLKMTNIRKYEPFYRGGGYLSDTGSVFELKSDQENNVRIVCCQDRKRPTSKTLLPYIMHTLIFMC